MPRNKSLQQKINRTLNAPTATWKNQIGNRVLLGCIAAPRPLEPRIARLAAGWCSPVCLHRALWLLPHFAECSMCVLSFGGGVARQSADAFCLAINTATNNSPPPTSGERRAPSRASQVSLMKSLTRAAARSSRARSKQTTGVPSRA